MDLTHEEEQLIIELYVTQKLRIQATILQVMKLRGHRYADMYVPISDYLRNHGLMRVGTGVRFGTDPFKWKKSTCEGCKAVYQPTGRGQRWCSSCREISGWIIRYGITADDYRSMVEQQRGGCAVCQIDLNSISSRNIHIDHDHRTGIIRGVVCFSCNVKLSTLDNHEWCEKAREYLARPGLEPRCDCMVMRAVKSAAVKVH